MSKKQLIIDRLDGISKSISERQETLALLGLGSIGEESVRLDDFSDLDFFLIVEKGHKKKYIDDISWLTDVYEAGYYYKNTEDGYKLLFNDGIYCEFAVFEPDELSNIPFANGKIIWKRNDFDESVCTPIKKSKSWKTDDLEWAFNEVLTCLYVGLCRYARGEKLSAMRFIQSFAVDIILASLHHIYQEADNFLDNFQLERRVEVRFPEFSGYLPGMLLGYDRTVESCENIIKFIELHYSINKVLKNEIFKMITFIRGDRTK